MERNFVYSYLEQNKKSYFPNKTYSEEDIEEIMLNASDDAANYLNGLKLSSPTIAMVLSVILGQLGADRFYVGDFVKGFLKLVTYGGFGIWWIIDIIKIRNICCEKNCEKLIELMQRYPICNHTTYGGLETPNMGTDSVLNDDISDILGLDATPQDTRPTLSGEDLAACFADLEED